MFLLYLSILLIYYNIQHNMFVHSFRRIPKIDAHKINAIYSQTDHPHTLLSYRLTHIHSKRSLPKSKNNLFNVFEAEMDDLDYATSSNVHHKKSKSAHHYVAKTPNQLNYYQYLQNKDVNLVLCHGPAGTGKTLFACNAAAEQLKNGNIQKIVLTRPVVSVDEELGFLPGDIACKMDPWTRPIFDVLSEFFNRKDIDDMVRNGIIEISPLAFMRGRTFKNAFIIADEMQNSSPNQMMMLTTRIGLGSKMAITGDLLQSDRCSNNGLLDLVKRIKIYKPFGIEMVELGKEDVFRSEVVSRILELYQIELNGGAYAGNIPYSRPYTPPSDITTETSTSSVDQSTDVSFGISPQKEVNVGTDIDRDRDIFLSEVPCSNGEDVLVDEALRAAEEVEIMEKDMIYLERNSELEVSAGIEEDMVYITKTSPEDTPTYDDILKKRNMDAALIPKYHIPSSVLKYLENKTNELEKR